MSNEQLGISLPAGVKLESLKVFSLVMDIDAINAFVVQLE